MIEPVFLCWVLVVLTLSALAALHVKALAWALGSDKPIAYRTAAFLEGSMLVAGPWFLWGLLGLFSDGRAVGIRIPLHLRVGSIFLYGAGCLVYVELRSLLSRGYSFRILLDLLKSGGELAKKDLIVRYGNGRGLRGLLAKRLGSLARLGLLRMEGPRAGSLTPIGRGAAGIGWAMRRLLRLTSVG
ncbi:MAG: hypothetical protein HYY14_02400 [Candidatus Omnitrophica bacterium]|nr:hypothetical protein [Candidatus Omnitrophota bacterium]